MSAAAKPSSSSSFSDSFVKVDYPAYPVLAATASHQAAPATQTSYGDPAAAGGNTGSGYGQYTAPQQQQHSYSGYQAHGQQESYGAQQQQPYSGASAYSYQPQAAQAQSYAQPAAYQSSRLDAAAGPPSWQELLAENGRPYYYNASTGVTQWEQPAGFV